MDLGGLELLKNLNDIPDFRAFLSKKNRLLEFVLDYYFARIDQQLDILRDAVEKATILHTWKEIDQYQSLVRKFQNTIDRQFDTTAAVIAHLYSELKRTTYALSFEADSSAIAGILKTTPSPIDMARFRDQTTFSGQNASARVFNAFNALKARVNKAFGDSLLLSETHEEAVARVMRALPKITEYKDVPRVLRKPKPLREAARPAKPPQFGFMTQDVWDALVDDYLADFPPRGPKDIVVVPSKRGRGTERYTWELEQEITNDFVKDVRDGQVDAAKANEITDFVWIAIIDDKTDECCLWRDGLTTKEIEKELRGRHKGDACKVIAPPAHFNCRCDLAPATDKLPDTEELGDFDSWLTKK